MNFGEIPVLGGTVSIGLKILTIAVLIDLAREAARFARGLSADFVDVAIRAVVAAMAIAMIPWLSLTLSQSVLAISNQLFGEGRTALLNESFRAALRNFDCDVGTGFFGGLEILFSPEGLLLILAHAILYAALLVKLVMIDVLWPIVFTLTVYLGVISIPVTFLKELGGLSHYIKGVISVALWPVVFSFLMVLVAAIFPKTIEAVANGKGTIVCEAILKPGTSSAAPSTTGSAGASSLVMPWKDDSGPFELVLKFLAISLGLVVFMIKTPAIASMAVGNPGQGITGALASVCRRKG